MEQTTELLTDQESILAQALQAIKNGQIAIALPLISQLSGDSAAIDATATAITNSYWLFDFLSAFNKSSDPNLRAVFLKFSNTIRSMFLGSTILFTDTVYNLPLKLAKDKDRSGDHGAYGSSKAGDSGRFHWKLTFSSDGSYCTIQDLEYSKFLKVAKDDDKQGDRRVYGGNNENTDRFHWKLYSNDSGNSFYLRNIDAAREMYLGGKDDDGDRRAWSRGNGQGFSFTATLIG